MMRALVQGQAAHRPPAQCSGCDLTYPSTPKTVSLRHGSLLRPATSITRTKEQQYSAWRHAMCPQAAAALSAVSASEHVTARIDRRTDLTPAVQAVTGGLPIGAVMADILHALDTSSCMVLQAPPGAGKTTAVPLALLAHAPAWLAGQKIVVLEPRRVAAKGAARRMASVLQEPLGGSTGRVGYRVRADTRVGPVTVVEVVTEGILVRMLQSDPALEGVGAVLIDEFHERGIGADSALTLCLAAQAALRPDLRVVVMSATLGGGLGARVQKLMMAAGQAPSHGHPTATANSSSTINDDSSSSSSSSSSGDGAAGSSPGQHGDGGDARLIVSEGRSYPVAIEYLGPPKGYARGDLEEAVASAIGTALRCGPAGDVLAFLPGVGEIREVQQLLEERGGAAQRGSGVQVFQLHGNMDPADQDAVIQPRKPGAPRRVILATPIAESSLTLEGVVSVVDSGLRRAPRFDPATAVNRLDTVTISQASAEQRAGRAGRTAPGVCYRLWDARGQSSLPAVTEPEILVADLAPLALELALWGSPDGGGLPWLDAPPAPRLAEARELLEGLGAVEGAGGSGGGSSSGTVTATGRILASLGLHPRWGSAALRGASAWGCGELAAVTAALLGERDILRGPAGQAAGADVKLRLQALANPNSGGVDRAAAQRILTSARDITASLSSYSASPTPTSTSASSSPSSPSSQGGGGGIPSGAGSGSAASVMGSFAEASVNPSEDDDNADMSDDDPSTSDTHIASNGSEGLQRSSSRRGRLSPEAFAARWQAQMNGNDGLVGALVAAAYPDRIARRRERGGSRAAYELASGRNVRLPKADDPLMMSSMLVVAEIGGTGRDGGNDNIRLAASLPERVLTTLLLPLTTERQLVLWSSSSKSVVGKKQRRVGCLVLSSESCALSDEQAMPALMQGVREMGGVSALGLSKDTEAWRARVVWLRMQQAETLAQGQSLPVGLPLLPDLSDQGLLATAHTWMGPHLSGARSKADILRTDWNNVIRSLVPWSLHGEVDAQVPPAVTLPTGTRAVIDYSREPPIARAKIQEVFGLSASPSVAGGRVRVALELLAPNSNTLQVTSDLAAFWAGSYAQVRKEMRGAYPRHVWPEDPLQAEATKLTKRAAEKLTAATAAAEAAAAASGVGGSGSKAGSKGAAAGKAGGSSGGGGGNSGGGKGGGKKR